MHWGLEESGGGIDPRGWWGEEAAEAGSWEGGEGGSMEEGGVRSGEECERGSSAQQQQQGAKEQGASDLA